MTAPARYSLTRRLILAVLLVEAASALALIVLAGVYEATTRFHALDTMLRGRAASVLGSVQDAEDAQDNLRLDGSESLLPVNDIFLVLDEHGHTVGQSKNWQNAEQTVASTGNETFFSMQLGDAGYRVVRVPGLRVIDSADEGGGVRRNVTIYYGRRTAGIWAEVIEAVAFYTGASLLLLVISGLVLLRLLRRGLAPLHELAAQAAQVSVRAWQFEPSDRARAVGELAPLIAALETVLAGLERSFAQQSQFVSDAAHELKTSVAVIKSSLQLLTMRTRSAEEYVSGLARLQADCARLEELVASMLTLAGLEAAANLETGAARTELGEVARTVADQFASLAEVAAITIEVQSPVAVWVAAERDQVRLLCSNLVHNALQHSGAGDAIRLHVERVAGDTGELQVADEGSGIPPEALPFVFDRFYRSDPSRSRRTGGTGLGLAISRAIAVRFHGDLRLASVPGQGTRATLRLPLVQEHADATSV